jgi:predicted RNA-binding Zn-ribbon protein involved in translation (DUF1610 family)
MFTKNASASRNSQHTEPHRCSGCGKTFWAKSGWNGVWVTCPRCGKAN